MGVFVSKLATQLVSPLFVSTALGALALGLLALRRRRAAAAALAASLTLVWGASTRPAAAWLGGSLESRHPPRAIETLPRAGAIVVLGGALRMPEPPELWSHVGPGADRLIHAARLYRAGRAPRLVTSGGPMPWSRAREREGQGMADLLAEWGVPREALLVEDRSRNTYENAVETRKLLAARGIDDVLLVTSAMHMRRALAVFRSVGLRARPAATDYRALRPGPYTLMDWLPSTAQLAITSDALKEYLGHRVYRLRGWIRE